MTGYSLLDRTTIAAAVLGTCMLAAGQPARADTGWTDQQLRQALNERIQLYQNNARRSQSAAEISRNSFAEGQLRMVRDSFESCLNGGGRNCQREVERAMRNGLLPRQPPAEPRQAQAPEPQMQRPDPVLQTRPPEPPAPPQGVDATLQGLGTIVTEAIRQAEDPALSNTRPTRRVLDAMEIAMAAEVALILSDIGRAPPPRLAASVAPRPVTVASPPPAPTSVGSGMQLPRLGEVLDGALAIGGLALGIVGALAGRSVSTPSYRPSYTPSYTPSYQSGGQGMSGSSSGISGRF